MIPIFKHIHLSNWRQFRRVDLEFHERLTILTGSNGAGKTTILNLLSRHFGWAGNIVSTPRRRGSKLVFSADLWTEQDLIDFETWLLSKSSRLDDPPAPTAASAPQQEIGELAYGDGTTAALTVPAEVGTAFEIGIDPMGEKRGLHIPSHRPIFPYQSIENIPTIPRRRDQAFTSYRDIVKLRYYGGHHPRTPNYYMKETLIAWAAFGYGNEVIDKDPESLATFRGFEEVLATMLPTSLGFERIVVRLPEVVLVTRSGDFSLDAVSGGIASLIDLAWQVFMYASDTTEFAVTIDEPENHLHPELQRSVLGNLLRAFPNTQFICATHNPFIVTSVPESHVYAFRYGPDHRVTSESLSALDRTGSANEVLRDILGMPSSSPSWVEEKLSSVQRRLEEHDLTDALVRELRESLAEAGLERYVPKVLANLAEKRLESDKAEPQPD